MDKLFLLVLLYFYSLSLCALESTDKLSTQIIKIYDKNILVVNRGLEDAIFKADHGKFTSDDGFIARGICIKATLLTSHWKIYRVVRPQLVSRDTLYTLNSINQSEMPPGLIKFSKVDFTKYYNDISDNTANKELQLQNERVAKFDLPDNAKNTDAYKEMTESKYDKFIKKNFSDENLKNDLQNSFLNIFASPISWQTRYNQKELHYGVNFYNTAKKYSYKINSIETQRKIIDPITESGLTSKSSHHDVQVSINNITESISLLSSISYDKEKIGATYYPYNHYQLGILGVRLHIIQDKPEESLMDLSYVPTFDMLKISNPDITGRKLLERDGIRHQIRLRMYGNFSKKFSNKTQVLYAPYLNLNASDIDYEDTYIQASSLFSYQLGGDFFWDFLLEYEKDDLRGEIYNIPPENTKQTFRLRYRFDL